MLTASRPVDMCFAREPLCTAQPARPRAAGTEDGHTWARRQLAGRWRKEGWCGQLSPLLRHFLAGHGGQGEGLGGAGHPGCRQPDCHLRTDTSDVTLALEDNKKELDSEELKQN